MQDRLATLTHVRGAGISVCAGGIIGLGEGPKDRVGLLHQVGTQDMYIEIVRSFEGTVHPRIGLRCCRAPSRIQPLDLLQLI